MWKETQSCPHLQPGNIHPSHPSQEFLHCESRAENLHPGSTGWLPQNQGRDGLHLAKSSQTEVIYTHCATSEFSALQNHLSLLQRLFQEVRTLTDLPFVSKAYLPPSVFQHYHNC